MKKLTKILSGAIVSVAIAVPAFFMYGVYVGDKKATTSDISTRAEKDPLSYPKESTSPKKAASAEEVIQPNQSSPKKIPSSIPK